ncbi:cytochrome P450 [Blastocladiella britannica]|nr:cytochrome P450 [Blastocladiella britannica]
MYKINIFNQSVHITCDADIAQQVVFESPFFTKQMFGVLLELQDVGGRGLFTSNTDDPKWRPANKVLTPTFSAGAMKLYTGDMSSAAIQLCNVLGQMEGSPIACTDWMTRFTLETIGVCGFGYPFHMLESPDSPIHPFVTAMSLALNEIKARSASTRLRKMLPTTTNANYTAALHLLRSTVETVITERRALGAEQVASKRDLLSFMLTVPTEGSGQPLDTENIRDQVLTFLIAGHETTATLLSWTIYQLTQNPMVEARVLEEAVRVCGSDPSIPITFQQVGQLTYITQVLKETLRLYPPVPILGKMCKTSTVLKGVSVQQGEGLFVDTIGLHRSRKQWGPNADVYSPDHFTKENEAKRHPFAWLPFSFGERSCIGAAFALQEAKIGIATLIRRFTFGYDGPVPAPYDPQSLTTRPRDLHISFHARHLAASPHQHDIAQYAMARTTENTISTELLAAGAALGGAETKDLSLQTLTVVWGSNMGTSQEFALQVVSIAKRFHIANVHSMSLDEWVATVGEGNGCGPAESSALIIITSTYNGMPPDNAREAARWFKAQPSASTTGLTGLPFAVFGCGNKQWRTFGKFPTEVDQYLGDLGAARLLAPGQGDADCDIDADFTLWHAKMWVALQAQFGLISVGRHTQVDDDKNGDNMHPMLQRPDPSDEPSVHVQVVAPGTNNGSTVEPRPGPSATAAIAVNRELLQLPSDPTTEEWMRGRSTRHIELTLDVAYQEGDHLELWPENDPEHVRALANHLGVGLDQVLQVFSVANRTSLHPKSPLALLLSSTTSLPQQSTDDAVPVAAVKVQNLLARFVDLAGPVPRALAIQYAQQSGDAALPEVMQADPAGTTPLKAVQRTHPTALAAMLATPGLTVDDILLLASAMLPRRYSIASSANKYPGRVSLCVGGTAPLGLAATFLARAAVGDTVQVKVCANHTAFHLPESATVPIIMISAGTGISPFLGFLQERDARGLTAASGAAEAHMFYGCRHPGHDHVYAAEMRDYVARRVLTTVHVAYSRHHPSSSSETGIKYVQHAIAHEADLVMDLLSRGGRIYVCGSAKGLARDVFKAVAQMAHEKLGVDGDAYVQGLQAEGRYLEDVWG